MHAMKSTHTTLCFSFDFETSSLRVIVFRKISFLALRVGAALKGCPQISHASYFSPYKTSILLGERYLPDIPLQILKQKK
jgi:hypothetical protein